MKNLRDLFEHQLQDLYSAETQLLDALPTMAKKATDKQLKKAFEDHLEQTRGQKERLVKICKELGVDPEGEKCLAMEGLIREAEHFLEEDLEDAVLNAGLIAEAQRVEHYEISGYGTAVRYARELGLKEIAATLQETLDEEYEADQKLDNLAEMRLNEEAIS